MGEDRVCNEHHKGDSMLNIDDAIKRLEQAIPGLKVENYKKVGDNVFNMDLVLNGKRRGADGEIKRFRNIDQAFIDKVKAELLSTHADLIVNSVVKRCMMELISLSRSAPFRLTQVSRQLQPFQVITF
jgi:hypothetical protein